MLSEKIIFALNNVDNSFLEEARELLDRPAAMQQGRKKKSVRIILIAAVLAALMGASAYAVKTSVASPEAAAKVALQEIEVWKEMGLLSPNIHFEGEPNAIVENEEKKGNDYWYGRLFSHSYDVRWYLGPGDWGDQMPPENLVRRKYGCNLQVDTLTGKIIQAWIDARPEKNEEPVGSVTVGGDPDRPEAEESRTLYFYDNFDDIFPADMTVDRFLTLLAEYWGFSGYRLADTVDEAFYDSHWSPVSADSLLKDVPSDNTDNYYMTVFFDGDQEGAPMYMQLKKFPGYVQLSVGTGHGVG